MGRSVVLVVGFLVALLPSEVGSTYLNRSFMPEVENGVPDCVQHPRDTYCMTPKKYPKDRILYLLENKMFDVDALLMDETRDSYIFEASYRAPPKLSVPKDPPPSPPSPFSGYLPPPPSPPSSYEIHHHHHHHLSPSTKIVRSSRRRQRRQASPTDLCPYQSDFIMPRAALNNRGSWMFLVNLDEVSPDYTQLVESKKCISDTCSGACNVPDDAAAVCQQQYLQKRLVCLHESGDMLIPDIFWLPSNCACKIHPV